MGWGQEGGVHRVGGNSSLCGQVQLLQHPVPAVSWPVWRCHPVPHIPAPEQNNRHIEGTRDCSECVFVYMGTSSVMHGLCSLVVGFGQWTKLYCKVARESCRAVEILTYVCSCCRLIFFFFFFILPAQIFGQTLPAGTCDANDIEVLTFSTRVQVRPLSLHSGHICNNTYQI